MAEDTTKIIKIVVDSRAAIDGSAAATRALANLEKQAGSIDGTLSRMEKGLASMGSAVKAHLALALAEVGARMIQMGKDAFNAAAGLEELAEQLGISARHLQGLQYAAVQNGLGLEQLERGVAKFSVKMGEAANGSKEMIEALQSLGVKNLDAAGKMRPTADMMQEVAAKIIAIEEPARRSAASVAFFDRAGTKFLPVLGEMAKGLENTAQKAEHMGAMISGSTIKRLDALADRFEIGKREHQAYFANLLADAVEALDGVDRWLQGGANNINKWLHRQGEGLGDWLDTTRSGLDEMVVAGGKFVASFLGVFANLPTQLGKLFVDGMNLAISGIESGLNTITATLADKVPWLGVRGGGISFGRIDGGGASVGSYLGSVKEDADRAEAELRRRYTRDYAGERSLARVAATLPSDFTAGLDTLAGGGGIVPPHSSGAGTSTVKGAGEDTADRIAKLRRDTARELEAAEQGAIASTGGARAVADLEEHFKALKAAQDAYGKTADANKDSVNRLTAEIEKSITATERAKNLKGFNLDTEALEKTNILLEAENRLIDESTETRARELALIKVKHEVESKGLDLSNEKTRESVERRRGAIEQNEKLKSQGEDLKRTNELWTEPLKQALRTIQSSAADLWEGILTSGRFTFESLGDLFYRVTRRMAAEFLALATIRPVMSVVVEGLSGLGLVSPATATALGFPQGGASGGGFFGSMFSPGGALGFFNQPITPTTYGGAPGGYGSITELLASGQPGALGGMTWGQGISGLGSIGLGAYGLASSGGNVGKMIGGAAGIIGGGLGLAASAGLIGSAFGPIGMGIGLLGGLLGASGLFDGGEQKPFPVSAYSGGNLQFTTAGGAFNTWGSGNNGGSSLAGQLAPLGKSLRDLVRMAGGTFVPGSTYGIAVGTNTNDADNSQQFGVTGDILTPGGGSIRSFDNIKGQDMGNLAQMLASFAWGLNVTRGGVTGVSDTLVQATRAREASGSFLGSFSLIQNEIQMAAAYDKLGKETIQAEAAIKNITDSFVSLRDWADEVNLSLAPITAEETKQKQKLAADFMKTVDRGLKGFTDPLGVELDSLHEARDAAIKEAQYMFDHIKDSAIDMARVTEYYTKLEARTREQFYASQVTGLQNLIKRLTYGDLANASPDTSLAGTGASYRAALAQARAGDQTAVANLSGYAETYVDTARGYFASGPEYAALVVQIRRDLEEVVAGVTGGAVGSGGSAANLNQASQQIIAANDQLREIVGTQSDQIADLKNMVTSLVSQLRNLATNRM